MSKPEDVAIIICALADCPFTVPGSSFEHSCKQCGTRVMMAPSGQAYTKRKGLKFKILCYHCGMKYMAKHGDEIEPQLANDPEEIRRELANAKPNPWRNRN